MVMGFNTVRGRGAAFAEGRVEAGRAVSQGLIAGQALALPEEKVMVTL